MPHRADYAASIRAPCCSSRLSLDPTVRIV
jgi:hypothetical protein